MLSIPCPNTYRAERLAFRSIASEHKVYEPHMRILWYVYRNGGSMHRNGILSLFSFGPLVVNRLKRLEDLSCLTNEKIGNRRIFTVTEYGASLCREFERLYAVFAAQYLENK